MQSVIANDSKVEWAVGHRGAPRRFSQLVPLVESLHAVLVVWTFLCLPAVVPLQHRDTAISIAYACALAFVWAGGNRPRIQRRIRPSILLSAGVVFGLATYPAWLAVIGCLGLAVGLPPPPPAAPLAGTLSHWFVIVLLTPILEEVLYREYVFSRLRRLAGPFPSIFVTSILFAIPHLDAWPMFTTFQLGLVLGFVRASSNSLAVCIGIHAGLNLAFLLWGTPGTTHPFSPWVAGLGGALFLYPFATIRCRRRLRT